MAISYIDHPHEAAIRRTNAQKLLEQVKETHKRIKGRFVTIPGITPNTQIFIREGHNVNEVIDRFIERYVACRNDLIRGAAAKVGEI